MSERTRERSFSLAELREDAIIPENRDWRDIPAAKRLAELDLLLQLEPSLDRVLEGQGEQAFAGFDFWLLQVEEAIKSGKER